MKISQKDRIINYIREFGSISSWEAYADLGITQLGARIDQLKKEGYEFKTEWESNTNRFGEKTDYKRYYLADMISEPYGTHIKSKKIYKIFAGNFEGYATELGTYDTEERAEEVLRDIIHWYDIGARRYNMPED